MPARPLRLVGLALTVGLVAVACSGGGGKAAPAISLASPAFAAGGRIPTKYACDGDDVSPPLSWSGVPAGAVELALTLEDPDAPNGTFVHWVLWGVDPRRPGLDEGAVPAGARQGRTSAGGQTEYVGPCPPEGSTHHYVFTLYVLDRRLDLPAGAPIGDLRAAMKGKVRGQGRLTATYGR